VDGLVDLRVEAYGNLRPVIVSADDVAFVVLVEVEMKEQKKFVSRRKFGRGAEERCRGEKQRSLASKLVPY
jgi:hypothetical protein